MAEVGIDISHHTCDPVDRYVNEDFDLVITVCDAANENCPSFAGARHTIHHAFLDPDSAEVDAPQRLDVFRQVRDEIGAWAKQLVATDFGTTVKLT